MTTEQARLCVARGRAYDLLGTAMLDGLREDRRAHFQAVPALRPHIDDVHDSDRWAAAHYTAFSLEIPPFESAFLSQRGQMDDGDAVRAAHARGGFGGARTDVPADHAGTALQYLSWLSAVEADAIADGQDNATAQAQALTRDFIDAHLGRWIDALAVGLQTTPGIQPFFAEAAALAAELIRTHRAMLQPQPAPWMLPEVSDPLTDPQTRLADLAQHLCTPSLAGGVLSRSGLASVGRATAVPKGFGSRALMLTNLMSSAAELGQLSEVLYALKDVVHGWTEAHRALGAEVWACRAEQTEDLLMRMDEAAALRE